MKILRNYILSQISYPLLMCVFTLSFIFIIGNLVKIADLILNKGVNFFDLMKFMGLIIPEVMIFTLPTSLLVAILLVFGNLAENNEITAMRASGVNILGVMMPVLALGLFLSAGVLVLSDQVFPDFSFESRKVLKRLFYKDPFAHLKPGVPSKLANGFVIVAREIEGDSLYNVTVYQPQDDGAPTRTITAESCEVDRSDRKLKIRLFSGTIDEPDREVDEVFHKLDFDVYELPIFDFRELERRSRKPREHSLDQIYTMVKMDMISDPMDERVYIMEFHKKLSFSLSPFIFALIGMPVAIVARRGNMLLSFGIASILMTFYYMFFSWAQVMSVEGNVPAYIALWVPPAVFFALGIFSLLKVLRI